MRQMQKKFFLGIPFIFFVVVSLFLLCTGTSYVQAQGYSVTLNILNTPQPTGEIAVVSGNNVQVEFIVIDPNGELSSEDRIRLTRVDNGYIIQEVKRGTLLQGVVTLNTDRSQADGAVKVQYIHNGVVLVSVPSANRMLILADDSELELLRRISALELTDPVPGPVGPAGPQGPQGPMGPAGPQGIPGNLALSGQSCPSGYFVTGFDANGNIICIAAQIVSVSTCGDSIIAGAEGCDDHNTTAGDGCSSSCIVEAGWTCSGQPSLCSPISISTCGDGIIAGAEGCDDHNTTAGDGCSSSCLAEAGWTCSGQPSLCSYGGPGAGPYVCSGVSADCPNNLIPYADLYQCNLTGANLYVADLSHACLHGAILINANLFGAVLVGADLSNADLSGADMGYTDLTNTNLTNANLSGVLLDSVIWWNTTCPDGTNSNNHMNTCIGHLL